MDHKSTAIVLHTIRYGDSGLVVKTFTRELGPVTYMARGVRGKSKKANLFQPLTFLEVTGKAHKAGSMINIREAAIKVAFHSLPFDIVKRSVGMFIAEILYRSLQDEQPNEQLYLFLEDYFIRLDREEWEQDRHFAFLSEYAGIMGIRPDISKKEYIYFDLREGEFSGIEPHHPDFLKGDEAQCFAALSVVNEGVDMPRMHPTMRSKMLDTWIRYFRMHLDGMGEIKSHKVLETVLH